MSIQAVSSPPAAIPTVPRRDDGELKETFRQFVGETLFGQMLGSMRKTQRPTPYFNGGRAEEVFQGQLDQELAKRIATESADRFADPMFELFLLQNRG